MRITLAFEGIDSTLAWLDDIDKQTATNAEKALKELVDAAEAAWQEFIPKRTHRLSSGAKGDAQGMTATFTDSVYYYEWVDKGHRIVITRRTRSGIKYSEQRGEAAGREMTKALEQWVKTNLMDYLKKSLSDL